MCVNLEVELALPPQPSRLLDPLAVHVGLAVSLSGTIYADTELGTQILADYFLEGKGLFFFCSNSLMKIERDCAQGQLGVRKDLK